MNQHRPSQPLRDIPPNQRYVAFVDILGFGSRVLDEFDSVLDVYQDLIDLHPTQLVRTEGVSTRILSDAFVVISEAFEPLVPIIRGLHMITLSKGYLIRGGIGFGRHIEATNDGNYAIVSQALVHAVGVEKRIKHPCVAIHESVPIPPGYLDPRFTPFDRGVLCFDGISMICPLSLFWGRSAIEQVLTLKAKYPEHAEKYDWFLRLCGTMRSGDPLIPKS